MDKDDRDALLIIIITVVGALGTIFLLLNLWILPAFWNAMVHGLR